MKTQAEAKPKNNVFDIDECDACNRVTVPLIEGKELRVEQARLLTDLTMKVNILSNMLSSKTKKDQKESKKNQAFFALIGFFILILMMLAIFSIAHMREMSAGVQSVMARTAIIQYEYQIDRAEQSARAKNAEQVKAFSASCHQIQN